MNAPLPDDLDQHFRAFFRTQVPSPWPDAPLPRETQSATVAGRASRSQWVLAASVVVLMGFGWTLSDRFQPTSGGSAGSTQSSELLNNAKADGRSLMKSASPTNR